MTQEYFQPILDWIGLHPNWAGFIVFLISLIESVAIIGLIIPGTPVMFAIGLMMGTGDLPFWQTMSWAIFGAVVGDGISYWLGHHFHEKLRGFWPFKQFPKILAHGEKFFLNHGGKSIVFGRFGPVRPVIPVIAGMMDMKPKRFLFFNIFSAFIWAPAYTLPGVLVGVSLGSLSPEIAKRAIVLALLLVLALWLIYMFLRTIGSWIAKLIRKGLSIIWSTWQASHNLPSLHRIFKTRQGSEEGQFGLALLFLFAASSFAITWIDVYYGMSIIQWNEAVYQLLRALYSERVIDILAFLTELGNPWVLLPAVAAVGLWLLWRQRISGMFCWLLTIGIGFLSGHFVKIMTAIPRPEGLVYLSHQYAFPSGHTLTATLAFGLAATFIHPNVSHKRRWIPWTISLILIFTVAFSRLYLGMHWFTDIIGSLTLGIACIAMGMFIYRRIESRTIPLRAILIPGVFVLCIMFTLFTSNSYAHTRKTLARHWHTQILNPADWWQGKATDYELYRTGAVKRKATLFDVQWLGSIESIQTVLKKAGWQEIPRFNFKTAAQLLANNPSPNLFPVMPKFHRDRLPVLIVAKTLDSTKRLVLQLWQSDYMTEQQVPLWVGTLRAEKTDHPLPMINLLTLFLETPEDNNNLLKELAIELSLSTDTQSRTIATDYIAHDTPTPSHTILLINSS